MTRYPILAAGLLLGLSVAVPAAAQSAGSMMEGLPPPGTMSRSLPEGMELYMSLWVSDTAQEVTNGVGGTAVEAKVRTRMDCQKKAQDCAELVTMPVRNHCMAIAGDRGATPGKRAIFAATGEAGKQADGVLGQKVLAECKASGAQQCEVQIEYCF